MDPATAINELQEILDATDPHVRYQLSIAWSRRVFDESEDIGDAKTDGLLRDLALDLTYYEPDAELRREDASYYDGAELERRIHEVVDTFA